MCKPYETPKIQSKASVGISSYFGTRLDVSMSDLQLLTATGNCRDVRSMPSDINEVRKAISNKSLAVTPSVRSKNANLSIPLFSELADH
jgi:hypothetical protein